MASQQQSRPLFRFASMVRPAAQPAQPPASAPPAPSPQLMFRPTTPFRPPLPAVTATQPSQPQEPTPQTPATAAPPAATAVAPPQPAVSAPRSPIPAPQPQPVAAASPRSTLATPPPRSPVVPPQSAVSPPKSPSPRAITDVPKSPVIRATTSVPQSPSKTLAANVTTERAPTSTPDSSLPQSPKTKLADSIQALINQSSPSKAPSPFQNVILPNLAKSQIYSPQTKPTVSHPLSPLKLPPSQLELESKIPPQVDQKSVVVHETTRANSNGRHVLQTTRNGKTVENGKQESVKKDKEVPQKKLSNSDNADDSGMSVLTLAGENKGAIMELSPSRKTYSPQSLQKKRNPKPWSSEDDGEKSGSESGRKGDRMQNKSLPMNAFMNSNVQGINNSILHNASCTHHDPGVHLVFARKTNGSNGFHVKGSPKS